MSENLQSNFTSTTQPNSQTNLSDQVQPSAQSTQNLVPENQSASGSSWANTSTQATTPNPLVEQNDQKSAQTNQKIQDFLEWMQRQTFNFNYLVTRFFLDNSRLTILALILLVGLGILSLFLLKTTGFPSPEVGVVVVETVYPGASSDTVAKEVTTPLEGALRNVGGIKTYSSFSTNSLSRISATIDSGVNVDNIRNQIDSAVKSVNLPSGAETPKVTKPEIGGPDFVLSVSGSDPAKVYDVTQQVKKDLAELPETSRVQPIRDLDKRVLVKVDTQKMTDKGLNLDQIKTAISSLGASIPVTNGVTLNDTSVSLVTSNFPANLENLKNLQISPTASSSNTTPNPTLTPNPATTSQTPQSSPAPALPVTPVKLQDIADIYVSYQPTGDTNARISYHIDGQSKSVEPVVLQIRATKDADKINYGQKIQDRFKTYEGVEFRSGNKVDSIPSDKVLIVENYTVNTFNQQQVDEVVGGLIGGPLKGQDSSIAWIGWILGGIQLVFLVMLFFVSWRAAVIAAVSIPLSLVFSNIYLFLIGENLNTLVLFSLVLVIGLVVDPVLVILESIQRKIDIGLKGREAVLAAVKDVGNGLFLATLTNIIVFAPFGVISGVIGQIFRYIPLTVIPATIGSYVVPLIFLAWVGGLILKPSKNKTNDEEKNLLGIAKGLIQLNDRILNSARIWRLLIIIVLLIIPFGVISYYTSTNQVKSVSFTTTRDGNFLIFNRSYLSGVPAETKQKVDQEVINLIAQNENVRQVYPFPSPSAGSGAYFVELKPKTERKIDGTEIARDLDQQIKQTYGQQASRPVFFDSRVTLQQNGAGASDYQVTLAIKNDDPNIIKKASLDVGQTLQKVCYQSDHKVNGRVKPYFISDTCENGERVVTKVDDGFTGRENKIIEVLMDPAKLEQNRLRPLSGLLTVQLNQLLRSEFRNTNDKSVGILSLDNSLVGIYLDKTSPDPTTVEQIKQTEIKLPSGPKVKVADIATVQEKTPPAVIQKDKGQTIAQVKARLKAGHDDQAASSQVTRSVLDYYWDNDFQRTTDLGLDKLAIDQYSEGNTASFAKSLQDLLLALVLAIFFSYVVLAVFFQSLTLPLVILYTVPLTFIGVYPALAYFGGGQIGFLEIIGIIILIGIVENVAIFLIDTARQKIDDGWDEKRAISFASGIRLKPVFMTQFTAIASLAPLAVLSQFYNSISIVIIFGLLSSGFISLITTPILFIFFRWSSRHYAQAKWYHKLLAIPLFPLYWIVWAIQDKPKKPVKTDQVDNRNNQ